MEKERLKFCINRFDHFYDNVNNKSNVLLGLGTFVIGGLTAIYPYLSEHSNCPEMIWILILIPGGIAFSALLVVIIASIPYLSKEKSSLYYFNSIATKDFEAFSGESKNFETEEEMTDLKIQVHNLALGLRKKFKRLRIASILYTVMFLSMIPFFLFILLNFKH
jgi:hypothetical protein